MRDIDFKFCKAKFQKVRKSYEEHKDWLHIDQRCYFESHFYGLNIEFKRIGRKHRTDRDKLLDLYDGLEIFHQIVSIQAKMDHEVFLKIAHRIRG